MKIIPTKAIILDPRDPESIKNALTKIMLLDAKELQANIKIKGEK